MKQVSGFLSDDGNFFPSANEAKKHDAEMIIRAYCVSHNVDGDKFLSLIEAMADPITEYVHALNIENENTTVEIKAFPPKNAETREASVDHPDASELEKPQTVLEQPLDGHEPVSDLGNRSLSEGLRIHR